jgi:L-cystine transport system ATP-binding protein
MIAFSGLEKSFGDQAVLRGIDLEVRKGSVVAILGPSGGGKSTFLRCINFLETPDRGIIEIGDVRVDAREASPPDILNLRRKTAMVFQQFNLFRNLTVLRNVSIGLTDVCRLPETEARRQAEAMLEKVGLANRLKAYPSQLSGGQQQRVAIARALALKPELLLFDEPTSALDPELAEDVMECIRTVAKEGNTMLVVTHEIGFAWDIADEVVLLDGGVLAEKGRGRDFFRSPQTERAKQFLGNAMRRFVLAPEFAPASGGGQGTESLP